MKEFQLSKEQEIAFNFLYQLFHPLSNRDCGRTYVMICVAIQYAIDNPNTSINIIDHDDMHHDLKRRKLHITRVVDFICSNLPDEIRDGLRHDPRNLTIRYEPITRTSVSHQISAINDLKDHFFNNTQNKRDQP